MRLRIFIGLLVFSVALALCWLGGFDFDHRGFDTAYLVTCCAFAGWWAAWFPGIPSGVSRPGDAP